MSPKTSSTNASNQAGSNKPSVIDEWVEIVEPKSRKRIYANLETGVCAKHPPDGALVSKSEDFSDHWWELYDQKTGNYYYYNPEQQKTAWTKPRESSNSNCLNGDKKRLLIIPVSRLQTFKKLPGDEANKEKRDASTQTIASNLVSTGTQTICGSVIENEFDTKLRLIDLSSEPPKSSSCTHSNNTKKTQMHHRQTSDFTSRDRANHTKNRQHQAEQSQQIKNSVSSLSRPNKSSQHGPLSKHRDDIVKEDNYLSYFGPSSDHKDRPPISIQSPSKFSHFRNEDHTFSTSTFGNSVKPPSGSLKKPQQMTTNNLSHYLVREARAMGIALISDDELDDDEQDSDDDFAIEEDNTELRDDTSSHNDAGSDLNVSQDLCDDSSEGWKSFSDQDSPNSLVHHTTQSAQKSPIHCETSASFTFKHNLIDDEKNPAASMSQQLDHRKLVENFKKSRQTSSFGLHDSLGRTYKLDANQAVQRIKTVADNYFNHDKDHQSDRHLRQLSTLSTLPRPHKGTKDKVALSKQDDACSNIDADYDVVEENCGYYSDSERIQPNHINTVADPASKISIKMNLSGEPQSPNHFDRNKSTRGSTFSVESFARENLSRHPKKGGLLFNRKVKWSRMISWTKNSIKQPMISSVSSDLNADSISSFKLIQQFMGDRKITMTKRYRYIINQSSSNDDSKESQSKGKALGRSGSMNTGQNSNQYQNSNNAANIPDRLRDELAYELVVKGCSKSALRDEIYVQMARQLTENPYQESVGWGLILISILLSYFSPSSKFSPFLSSFLETHPHQMARDVCMPRLEKRLHQNWLTYCRKPADGKEISIVRLSITKWPQYCGVFGESLERIMSLQSCSPYLKTLRLPWILTTLGQKLIETGGAETEGLFRCAADHDLIAQLRLEIDCVDFRKITDAKQLHSLLSNIQDPHVIAGLLKLFFRQLQEPVFPSQIYDICLHSDQDGHMACNVFNAHLPNLNKDVVAYLIRLLQSLSRPETVVNTKMDSSNLSMVWAPNLLRVPHPDNMAQGGSKNGSKWSIANGTGGEEPTTQSVGSSQSMIFEQTRQEMQFIRALIVNLDTSFIENVI